MLWPNGTTTRPRVSSPFGPRPNVGAFSFHYGTDLIGYSTVRAAGAGKVTFAGWMNSAAGNTVLIDHGGGVTEVHMHLASFAVKRGDRVDPGDPLGLMGRTGNASGNCDHFEIRINGKSVDPMAYTAARVTGTPAGGSTTNPSPEEDDMSDRAEIMIEAMYSGIFGPANVIDPKTGKPATDRTRWARPFGESGGEAYYGMFDVLLNVQATVAKQAGVLSALQTALAQVAKSGAVIDMKAIEDAAERGAKDALGDLVLKADVDGS